jgi:sterol desaturase/sphingolipid hydroxylase (fatty acid hydroxylase superfamily)
LAASDRLKALGEHIPNILLLFLFLGVLVWETMRPCKVFRYGRQGARLWHGVTNLSVGFVGTAVSYLLFLPAWRGAAEWSGLHEWGLLHLMPATLVGRACAALVLLDLWTYWWHRMNHRIGFLWRLHRMHHSDPWMDVTTAKRFHPGEIVFSCTLRIPVILLSGVELWHVALYDAVMLAVVLFHHSNITVSSGAERLLRLVIPTPVMHKIHHSRVQSETDSNYTSLLSVWDRIFASFQLRSDWESVSFGLDGYDDPASQSLVGLIKTPFRNELPSSPSQPGDEGR